MKSEINLLRELVAHQDEPGEILALFRREGLDSPRLGRMNPAADPIAPYSRLVLESGPQGEIMLARWAPGRECAPHDHGVSVGWVFFLEGDFEEYGYRWSRGKLVANGAHTHPAGTHARVSKNEIHSCISRGHGLSLHVYFPRIERMRVYDLKEHRTIVVSDDCGAWIPPRPGQRIEENAWAS